MNTVFYTELDSPVGTLLITSNGNAITGLHMEEQATRPVIGQHWVRDDQRLDNARSQLVAYFEGQLQQFDLPLAGAGTPFQQQVWQALREIPSDTQKPMVSWPGGLATQRLPGRWGWPTAAIPSGSLCPVTGSSAPTVR